MKFALFLGCVIQARYPHIEAVSKKVLKDVDISTENISEFSCCPEPIEARNLHPKTALAISARNLALAEKKGLPIITLCNGCTQTLKNACHLLKDKNIRKEVNDTLSTLGYEYEGTTEVKHFLEVFWDDIGIDALKEKVKVPLKGIKVATHVGCHLLNPTTIMQFEESIFNPRKFDLLVEALGAEVVDYDLKNLCCGISFSRANNIEPLTNIIKDKIVDIQNNQADVMAVGCPTCFMQYDTNQLLAARKHGLESITPIMYYTQLLAKALGYSFDELLVKEHRSKNKEVFEKFKALDNQIEDLSAQIEDRD